MEQVLDYENDHLVNTVTPVKADVLIDVLIETGYDSNNTDFVCKDFAEGFSLCYQGSLKEPKRFVPDLKGWVQLWNFGTGL